MTNELFEIIKNHSEIDFKVWNIKPDSFTPILVKDDTYIYVLDGGWHGAVIYNEYGKLIGTTEGECFDFERRK